VKEYDSGLYDILPYYFSKMIVEIFLTSFFPCLFSVLVYFLVNFNLTVSHFFIFLGGVVFYVQIGTVLGIFLGAVVWNADLAIELAPAIFVPLMLMSGYTNNTSNIVVWLKWLEYISPVRYIFEFLVTNEFDDQT
jgi:ABC-type multidrug transport system permease subunit